MDFDLGAELLLGFHGKTTAGWLPEDEVVSSGGLGAGLNTFFRGGIVLNNEKHPERNSMLFMSLGPQIIMMQHNGKGVGTFGSRPSLNYTEGWNEYLFILNFSLGFDFTWANFSITPEIRVNVPCLAAATTTWEPNGNVEQNDAPVIYAYTLKVSRRFSIK